MRGHAFLRLGSLRSRLWDRIWVQLVCVVGDPRKHWCGSTNWDSEGKEASRRSITEQHTNQSTRETMQHNIEYASYSTSEVKLLRIYVRISISHGWKAVSECVAGRRALATYTEVRLWFHLLHTTCKGWSEMRHVERRGHQSQWQQSQESSCKWSGATRVVLCGRSQPRNEGGNCQNPGLGNRNSVLLESFLYHLPSGSLWPSYWTPEYLCFLTSKICHTRLQTIVRNKWNNL